MRTTLDLPSSRTDSTVAVPSTWPCMTCPPRRSPARSGSSRFTSSPSPSGSSDVRLSVSGITSASNEPFVRPTAVRQMPLTAIESPSRSSAASGVSTVRRPPSSARTTPFPATSPVNTSPLLEALDDQHVVLDALCLHREGARARRDVADAHALDGGPRLGPAEHQGRDEHARLVDLAGLEEGAREVRAALEQQRLDLARAELVERVLDARALVLAGRDDHVHPRGLEGEHGRARGRAGA